MALDLEEGLSAAVGAGLFVHEPVMGHDQEGLSVAAESVFGDEDMIVEYGPEIPQELVQVTTVIILPLSMLLLIVKIVT